MSRNVVAVDESASVGEIMMLIRRHQVKDFPVINSDSNFQGIVYETDILKVLYDGPDTHLIDFQDRKQVENLASRCGKLRAGDIMTRGVISLSPEDPIMRVGARMLLEKLSKLPVLQDDRVVGMVTQSDIFAAIVDHVTAASKDEKTEPSEPVSEPEVKEEAVKPSPPKAAVAKPKDGREKRFFRRVDMAIPVAYKPTEAGRPHSGKLGKTVNVSAGGLLMEVPEPIRESSLIEVALDLYQNGQPIKSTCRVVRCMPSPGNPNVLYAGLMYLAMDVTERKRIIAYLNQFAPEAA